jgi:hypothetical protein
VSPDAPDELVTELERLPSPIARVDVVGCARLGRHRVVKLRVQSDARVVVIQERWVSADGTWRLALVEATTPGPVVP